MLVKELLEILSRADPDEEVLISRYNGGDDAFFELQRDDVDVNSGAVVIR